eukprot:8558261-Pyramimonas_sp.AAC.1
MVSSANSNALLKAILTKLGSLAGRGEWAVTNLGLAFTAGKHQGCRFARAVRKKRFRTFNFRISKLRGLKVSQGKKARLFKAGILPTISFGMEVQSIAPHELLRIRRAAARAGGVSKR